MDDVAREKKNSFHVCVIRSDIREAEVPKQEVLDAVQRNGFSEEARFAIKLGLEEALCNAIKHGNKNDASKEITVRYAVTNECCEVSVRDEGTGFAPEQVPDPTSPDRLPLPDGRGIMLLRAYMDKLEFRENGREVYFMKRSGK